MIQRQIDLPWPSRDLHPNARVHWAVKARAAKKARADAAWAARAAGVGKIDAEALNVAIIFTPPSNRAHDLDGLVASVKSYIDGIADVVGVDDRNWRIQPSKDPARPLGNVRFVLTPADTWEHISEPLGRVVASMVVKHREAS